VRAVLVKLFDDRQLAVDAEVIDYVARRMERSLGAARETAAALDEEALALGRRVTKPVAAAVLARLTSDVD
jgi:chromosomal replication initiation ATPase DnaA